MLHVKIHLSGIGLESFATPLLRGFRPPFRTVGPTRSTVRPKNVARLKNFSHFCPIPEPRGAESETMAGIYLHIPFCKRICSYCDFYKSVRTELIDAVTARMHRELTERSGYLHDRRIETVYFGGGTPSLCRPEQLGGLIARIREEFDCSALCETTAEVNPDDLTPAYLEGLLHAGIDRLSIGIQSFDDRELRFMNRRHDSAAARQAVGEARRAGFRNLTIDLIFGVPGFGGDTLRHNLEQTLELRPQHISAYHLTIEPDTAFGRRARRGELRAVEEEVSEAEFRTVHDTLTAAGYEHYEVSNFALPGFRARHNSAYWNGREYLGIGPAAHSFDGRSRRWSTDTAESYAAGGPLSFEEEMLSDRDRRNEYLMTRLRTSDGLSLKAFEAAFGPQAAARLVLEARPLLEAETLRREGDRLLIPPERFLTSDAVIGTLFEPEPDTARHRPDPPDAP